MPSSHAQLAEATLTNREPVARCAACDGVGWYTLAVPLGHADFGKTFPCECIRTLRAARQADALLAMSNLATFRGQTFATFDARAPGVQLAYRRALVFARRPVGWLALFGPYGCGKTHLAAAIANAALAQGAPTLFVVVPDLLDHLRATFQSNQEASYDERFELVRSVALLVLDDLGTESPTPWAREKLYQLINHRYNHQLPTVFTSNVRPELLDPRIASRMHDAALGDPVVLISAADYRRSVARMEAAHGTAR